MSGPANKKTIMRHLFSSIAPVRSRRTLRLYAIGVFGLILVAIALLLPSTAAAIPGSGEFVALKSESGREITGLYNMIAKICLAILIIVEGALLFAIFKFRRRGDEENPVQNHGDLRLEFGWTMAALAIQVWIGIATIDVMFETETEPDDGIDMTVTAHAEMWDWNFEYDLEDRDRLIHDDLVVPAHQNVKLQVTSEDVIHAVFIPALGVKMDAVPGRFNHWWFRADGPVAQVRARDFATMDRAERTLPQTRSGALGDGQSASDRRVTGLEGHTSFIGSRYTETIIDEQTGEERDVPAVIDSPTESPYYDYNAIEYQGLCAELCGRGHWDMYFRAVVMTQSSFDRWYQDELEDVDEPDGDSIFNAQCAECHGDDGTGVDADVPSLVDNEMMIADEQESDHIDSVLEGPGRMPSFRGSLNDAEIAAVVNHERISWDNEGTEIEPEDVAERREDLGFAPFPAVDIEPVDQEDLMRTGERLYRSCASCHGDDGQSFDSDLVPDIAGSDIVVDELPDELARILIQGRDSDEYPGRKRPVARSLSDLELAALLTFVRQSFGNEASVVQPYEVRDIRRDID